MTFLEALKKVRPRIASTLEVSRITDSDFICDNLRHVGAPEWRKTISDKIGNVFSYEAWLELNHEEVYEQMRRIGQRAFQEGRLQWIDHMIKEENQAEYERVSRWDRLAGLIMPPSAYGLTDYPA